MTIKMMQDTELRKIMREHDPLWDRVPLRWEDAPFIGNGLTGAMLYFGAERDRLRLFLGRSDVGKLDYPGKAQNPIRLQLGTLDLCLEDGVTILGCRLRLDLWQAELRGTIRTTRGLLSLRAFAPTGSAGLRLDLLKTDPTLRWHWQQALIPSGRLIRREDRTVFVAPDFVPHLRTEIKSGGFAVVWGERPVGRLGAAFTCSVGSTPVNRRLWKSKDGGESARAEAEADFDLQRRRRSGVVCRAHRRWWRGVYRSGFFSLSHRELESLYWIQIYKFASTTRPDRPMIDNHGIWSTEPIYAFSTWDFNVQATYRLHLTANLQEFGRPFLKFMDQSFNRDTMWSKEHGEYRAGMRQQNFLRYRFFDPQEWEHPGMPCDGPGKFLWGVHNYYMHYRHTLDPELLPRLMLMLEAGINAMVAGMLLERDGLYHVPRGASWEAWKGRDPTGLLAVLRWALHAALEYADRAGVSPRIQRRWRKIAARIVPYPRNAQGYLLGEGQPPVPHRHWTHLMMLYPLDIADLNNRSEADLLRRSIELWAEISAGLDGNKPQAGFACPAAISLYAYLHAVTRRENTGRIAELADIFLYRDAMRHPCVWPATMYRESGPVIETPIFMAAALQECCLQSRRDGVHVFPAVPAQWPDAVFAEWHAEGDFLISARRAAGRTGWIHVAARSGGLLRLHTDMDLRRVYWNGRRRRPAAVTLSPTGCGLELAMPAGATLLLSRGPRPDLSVRPAGRRYGERNAFGLNARFLKPRPHFTDPEACRKPAKSHWLGGKLAGPRGNQARE